VNSILQPSIPIAMAMAGSQQKIERYNKSKIRSLRLKDSHEGRPSIEVAARKSREKLDILVFKIFSIQELSFA
jgi:hypothetical protein